MVKIIAKKNKEVKVNGPNNIVGTYPDPRQLFNNTELEYKHATRKWNTPRQEKYEVEQDSEHATREWNTPRQNNYDEKQIYVARLNGIREN